jgi:hypothetical protein
MGQGVADAWRGMYNMVMKTGGLHPENVDTPARRIDLQRALQAVEEHTLALCTQLRLHQGPAWVWSESNAEMSLPAMLHLAADCFGELYYRDNRAPGAVTIRPGIVMIDDSLASLALAVNHAKRQFVDAYKALAGPQITRVSDDAEEIVERVSVRKVALENVNKARFHYQHVSRLIVVERNAPSYVSFTWTHCRSVRKLSIADVRKLIINAQRANIEPAESLPEWKRLTELAPDEWLAQVKPARCTPKVNFVFGSLEKNAPVRRMVKTAVMPVLIVGEQLPRLRLLTPSPLSAPFRATRTDTRLQSEPFIDRFHLYRYLEGYRGSSNYKDEPEGTSP